MGKIGVDFAYLLWLIKARKFVQHLHLESAFTSTQHVTYARYWMPSPLSVLPVPFVWGPVGGGESIPNVMRTSFSLKGRFYEWVRDKMRLLGEQLSRTKQNATSSRVGLANTIETARRMTFLGAKDVRIMNSAALSASDQAQLAVPVKRFEQVTFTSIGRLLEWKGFQLGLEAFSKANIPGARYIVVGTGPFKKRLMMLASKLHISDRVEFKEAIPRKDLFKIMKASHALVHPSMHESGGYVCLEMMAAGNPIICLEAGGPALFVDSTCGFVAPVSSKLDAVTHMASAMQQIASCSDTCDMLGSVGRQRVRDMFSMSIKSDKLSHIHSGYAEMRSVELAAKRIDRKQSVREASPFSKSPIGEETA